MNVGTLGTAGAAAKSLLGTVSGGLGESSMGLVDVGLCIPEGLKSPGFVTSGGPLDIAGGMDELEEVGNAGAGFGLNVGGGTNTSTNEVTVIRMTPVV